jgi:hypothetical protein
VLVQCDDDSTGEQRLGHQPRSATFRQSNDRQSEQRGTVD